MFLLRGSSVTTNWSSLIISHVPAAMKKILIEYLGLQVLSHRIDLQQSKNKCTEVQTNTKTTALQM